MSRRVYLLIMVLCFLDALAVSWIWRKKGRKNALCVFSALTAVVLRVTYIIYTPHWIRQHDVIGFGNFEGQAPFIEWFVSHFSLPDFDPRERWGFFQPALHHILSAFWIRLQVFFGIAYKQACENVQVLTLIFVLVLLWYAYRIFVQAGLTDWPLAIAFTLSAIHPGFILLSGSINNDALCEMLTIMSLYYAMCWYKNRTMKLIVKTALCVGLSMMAKLSGVLSAPAVAFLFLMVLIREGKPDLLKYLKQYTVFALISFPLGLFFPLRNYLAFGVPLTYTPGVGEPVYGHSLLSRLFDLRTDSPFVHLTRRQDSYDEFNIFLSMLKTSLFGDTDFRRADLPLLTPFAWLLFTAGIMLAMLFLLAMIHCILRWREDKVILWYWVIALVIPFAFLIRLSFSIPYFSSQDFRYIQYVIVVQSLFLGKSLMIKGCKRELNPYGFLSAGITAAFGAFTTAVYVLLGVP